MERGTTETIVCALFLFASGACVGSVPDDPGGGGGGGSDIDDREPDAGPAALACDERVEVPISGRPVDLIEPSRLSAIAARLPCVTDPWLRGLLESPDTIWYDHRSIIPGYQDSFGDNVVAPIGMRPNTIARSLIDTAVPGGHAQIFAEHGIFHFPFGRPTGAGEETFVVNFWWVPRAEGRPLPVVWWKRQPSSLTHRFEWAFPRGTVLAEVIFLEHPGGEPYVFEIRTRTRELGEWRVDVFRPFSTASSLADALEARRADRADWAADPEVSALIAHLRDPGTLVAAELENTNFAGAFPTISGALDHLPALADTSILEELLVTTPFDSARGAIWKQGGGLLTWAATTRARFHVVPAGYNAGFLEVDEETCNRCHQDAGRPFKDWYPNIIAYGELWGEDESFSWHPFETALFVDSSGKVVNFNYDNRRMRSDLTGAGLLERYDPATHSDAVYRKLPGSWKNYSY